MDNLQQARNRRSSEEIVDAIFEALPVNSYEPISHIAAKAELDWKTAKRYLNLIRHIQEKHKKPWLQFMMVGEQPAYSRVTSAGRPGG